MPVYTIGHSTRELTEFIDILKQYDVSMLVDIRSVPRSRHTPQFNSDTISGELEKHHISYQHVPKLGGLRHATKDSINKGWHNVSFRGYADYMQTDEFRQGIEELLELTKRDIVAIMCAEAVPWRCHRSMVGDALLVRDIKVTDIFNKNKTQEEKITKFAKVEGVQITYPDDRGSVEH